jgi:hypothetical protein
MKLALFHSVDKTGYTSVLQEWADQSNNYVRISEFVDVEFPAEREKFQETLNDIDRQRQELRAITCRCDIVHND